MGARTHKEQPPAVFQKRRGGGEVNAMRGERGGERERVREERGTASSRTENGQDNRRTPLRHL